MKTPASYSWPAQAEYVSMAPTSPPEPLCKTPFDTPMHETMSPEAENIWLVPPTSVSLMLCSIPCCHSSPFFRFWDDVANYDSAESRYFYAFRQRHDISTFLKYLKVQPIWINFPRTRKMVKMWHFKIFWTSALTKRFDFFNFSQMF